MASGIPIPKEKDKPKKERKLISKKEEDNNKRKLHDKLWDIFSKYIRHRDKGTCFTCGARKWDEEKGEWTIKGFNAGHFIHNVLDFDEMNINCQCVQCNKWNHGQGAEYSIRLIRKYGLEAVEDLHLRSKSALAGEYKTVQEYHDLIALYKSKIAEYGT